jgi:hypothetical protein
MNSSSPLPAYIELTYFPGNNTIFLFWWKFCYTEGTWVKELIFCICACAHVYVCICTCICMHVYVLCMNVPCIHIWVCMWVYRHPCAFLFMCSMLICVSIHMCACMSESACVHACVFVCMCPYMHVWTCAYMCVLRHYRRVVYSGLWIKKTCSKSQIPSHTICGHLDNVIASLRSRLTTGIV